MTTPTDIAAALLAYLDEQIALCDAATPGPWWHDDERDVIVSVHIPPGKSAAASPVVLLTYQPRKKLRDADGTLAAAARTGYPALLRALRDDVRWHMVSIEGLHSAGQLANGHRVRLRNMARTILPPDQLAALGID